MAKRGAGLLAAGLAILSGRASPEPAPKGPMRLLVPAYFSPAGKGAQEWHRLIEAAASAPVVAIVNPDSGPGARHEAAYTHVIDRLRHAGGTAIGYVSTRYGKRPMAAVEADIDRWVRFYPHIQGIFLDEQAPGADQIHYYAELSLHARHVIPSALVVTNPGIPCAEDYLASRAADAACVFERGKEFIQFRRPEWGGAYPPLRFAAFLYQVPDKQQMLDLIRQAVDEGVGYVYVTDAGGANPWNRLCAYWPAEVAIIHAANQPSPAS